MGESPSPLFGLRHVGGMWRVVLAVWLVSVVVFLPARVVVWAAVGPTFAALPGSDLPDGEIALIATELLRPVWVPLAVAGLSGWFALWAWTVLVARRRGPVAVGARVESSFDWRRSWATVSSAGGAGPGSG